MDVLQMVLNYETPTDWVHRVATDYSNSYLLFEVHEHSIEWQNVVSIYSAYSNDVVKLERVQNPFQLGLFKIQEQKRISEGDSYGQILGYHVIHPLDKERALKFPLDYRRYQHKRPDLQAHNKQPKFFSDLASAYESGRHQLSYEGKTIVLVCDRFSFNVSNQGDYNIKYVVTLST